MITWVSCKKPLENGVEQKSEISKYEIPESDKFIPLQKNQNDFQGEGYKLRFNDANGNFTLFKGSRNLGEITLGQINYEGPGFSAYINKNNQIENIIIEATADIGTAWYYSVIIKDHVISNQFLIDEPRSNSDLYTIDKFITVRQIDDSLQYKFNKKLIAKYSKVTSELRSDENYFYLLKPIKNVTSNINYAVDRYLTEMSQNFRLTDKQTFDINDDGIEDIFIVLKVNDEFNSENENSKKSQVVLFVSDGKGFKKYVNNTIFPNDSNDQFDKIIFGSKNTFTVKLYNEIPNEYFIEKNITFLYEKQDFILHKFSIKKGEIKNELKISHLKPVIFESFDANLPIYK